MIEVRNQELYIKGRLFGDEKHLMEIIRKAKAYDDLKNETIFEKEVL